MAFRGDLEIYTVDSFSSVPFSGNPAGVCLDPTKDGLPDDVLRKVAAELNLSATGFVRKLSENDDFRRSNRFGLRWFTPRVEIFLCGHATLGAAAVLFNRLGNPSSVLYFEAQSGTLEARKTNSGISMDFPTDPPDSLSNRAAYEDLLKIAVPESLLQDVQLGQKNKMLLVRLKDDTLSRSEFEKLTVPTDQFTTAYTSGDLVTLMLTMRGSPGNGCQDTAGVTYDFVSRVFGPWAGISEDQCTGSAHTILGPYWSKILGKDKLYVRQCSQRGGELRLHVKQDGRISISAEATIMLSGKLSV